jgi:hypothetical protein
LARKLREGDAFAEQFRSLVPDEKVRELILVGLRATICEDPRVGIPLSETPPTAWYFFIAESAGFGIRKMTVVYSFEDGGDDNQLDWIDYTNPDDRQPA